MLTKGAIGNLVNRYKAVLKKCNLINTFGSLAVAAMLVMGGAGAASASPDTTYEEYSPFSFSKGQELKKYFSSNQTTITTGQGSHDTDDFLTVDDALFQLNSCLLVGHLTDKEDFKFNLNDGKKEPLEKFIIGGGYSGVYDAKTASNYTGIQQGLNTSGGAVSIKSVSITMTPNTVLKGEINGGGLAIGDIKPSTDGTIDPSFILDGGSYKSHVDTVNIHINGGQLLLINPGKNRLDDGLTRIRGGGISHNNAIASVGTANISITGNKGGDNSSVPDLPYTIIMGGGCNGGYYAYVSEDDISNNGIDGLRKIGYYFDNSGNKVWYNTTDVANITIDKMAYRKDLLGGGNTYNAKEQSWLGSTIFAGGDNCWVGKSNITLNSSTVGTVFAGGETYAETGATNITLNASGILEFYSGGKIDNSKVAGAPHIVKHDGLVGNVSISMNNNSAIQSYSEQIFKNAASLVRMKEEFDEYGRRDWVQAFDENCKVIWDKASDDANALKTWKGPDGDDARISFTSDGTNNRLYLKDGFISEAYLKTAQNLLADKGITVVRCGESDVVFGEPSPTAKRFMMRSAPAVAAEEKVERVHIQEDYSGATARAKTGDVRIEKNVTLHLVGVPEINDYYFDPLSGSEAEAKYIYDSKYASTELLTVKSTREAVAEFRSADGSKVILGNETEHTGGTISGKLRLANWAREADDTSASTLEVVGGRFTMKNLRAGKLDKIYVGSESSSAKLLLGEKTKLSGALVSLDPNWTGDPKFDVIENASHLVSTSGLVDASYKVGRNSVLTLAAKGSNPRDAEQKTYKLFQASGQKWGPEGITAALSVLTPLNLKCIYEDVPNDGDLLEVVGSIVVDGSATHSDFTPKIMLRAAPLSTGGSADASFGPDSMFIVSQEVLNSGSPAISGDGTLSVADGAAIMLENDNIKVGDDFTIAEFKDAELKGSGWSGNNVLTSYTLNGELSFDPATGKVSISITEGDIDPAYLPQNALRKANSISGDILGLSFLKKATAKYRQSPSDSISVVNEVARPAVTAGVQNTALRISDAASGVVLDHLSLAQHDGSQAIHSNGVDFWAAPMYGNLYTSGMNVAGNSVRGQFGGLALGADMEAGKFLGGKFRLGASINGGGGKSEAKGTASSVQNDYGFGGVNLYAGWTKDALNVMASVGYSFGDNEVEMYLPSSMDMGKGKADVDTSAITADLRAEYQLKTAYVDILPHAGVRYTALRTDSHDLKVKGDVLNSIESETQHIVQFPVGVTLSKDFDLAGWNVKPMADISFIPAGGDKDANTTVRFSGVNAVDSFDSRVMDSCSWAGTVGVQAEKGNMSFGLNYGVQTSSHETDQNIQVKFGWKF